MRMNKCPSPKTHCDHGYGRRNQCLFYGTDYFCSRRKRNLGYDRGMVVIRNGDDPAVSPVQRGDNG